MAENNPKPQLDQLGVAIGLLAPAVNLLTTTVGKLTIATADEELRKELLGGLNLVSQAVGAVVEMFPAPDGGVLH